MKTIVIGAGAIGLSSAYYLRKAGTEVVVVDESEPGSKASAHNAGWVVPSMSVPVPAPGMMPQALKWMTRRDSPLYVTPSLNPRFLGFMAEMLRNCTTGRFEAGLKVLAHLSRDTLQLFDDMAADGVVFESHSDPLTMLYTNAENLQKHAVELKAMEAHIPGFKWRTIPGNDLAKEVPHVRDGLAGGLQTFGDRSLDPASLTRGLTAACKRGGVEFRIGTAAKLRTAVDGSVEVAIGDEVLRADKIVVAAGVWTNKILAGIGDRVSLMSGKGYGYDLPLDADGPRYPLYLAEAKVAITPLSTKVRIAGTMGFGGINEGISRVRAEGLLTSLPKYFNTWPAITTKPRPQPWTGLRPMTPDGLPIIGTSRKRSNILIATGHAMLGVSLAPPTGKLIAEMATGDPASRHLSSLSATRFML
ncbi:FAD-dependent oxidoreductase [Pseudarthrobacter sp. HLT3-5]|uniref:NAD(P)/FAD-dependent oxidoreductase n=1 Tax=Pseudarthrobacter cellobiosi TaxID=2953654 RepID=UPI00208FC707|nr:FAD-dependent oxidoreductase [Pseudarthrobacter sp. HLT3-5]MCO4272944.1 FAD-dependent oxidoreductase [Pseudarthrobacter sp. HLT3-5]